MSVAFPIVQDAKCECVCAHLAVGRCSGHDRVGLVGQRLLPLVDCVDPGRFDEVQIAVLHQRLRRRREERRLSCCRKRQN